MSVGINDRKTIRAITQDGERLLEERANELGHLAIEAQAPCVAVIHKSGVIPQKESMAGSVGGILTPRKIAWHGQARQGNRIEGQSENGVPGSDRAGRPVGCRQKLNTLTQDDK